MFGGLVAAQEGASIQMCKMNGSVVLERKNDDNSSIGGLVGLLFQKGKIVNSYSQGLVECNDGNIGGLVGRVENAIIEYSYSIMKLQIGNSSNYGGLIGNINTKKESIATNCYWTPEISEVETSQLGIKIEDESDMHIQSTYEGWDFEDIWIMKEYPELRCFQSKE